MKKDIHPKYNTDTKVTCACGNAFVVGSVLEEIKTELCSACHPFFTGKQKLVDSARRVEKFKAKMDIKDKVAQTRKGKTLKRAIKAKAKVAKAEKEDKTTKVDDK